MESLRMFDGAIVKDGIAYQASVCGRERGDGKWEGWIEFVSADAAHVWRTDRETTQPNRVDLLYWATGLSTVFLEGALDRALALAERTAPLIRARAS